MKSENRKWVILLVLATSIPFVPSCTQRHEINVTYIQPRPPEVVDYTAGESPICQLHHTQMQRRKVPIFYGFMEPTPWGEERYAASTNFFPNAETYVPGGCVIGPSSPKKAFIYICPECEKAAHQWETAHPSPKS